MLQKGNVLIYHHVLLAQVCSESIWQQMLTVMAHPKDKPLVVQCKMTIKYCSKSPTTETCQVKIKYQVVYPLQTKLEVKKLKRMGKEGKICLCMTRYCPDPILEMTGKHDAQVQSVLSQLTLNEAVESERLPSMHGKSITCFMCKD